MWQIEVAGSSLLKQQSNIKGINIRIEKFAGPTRHSMWVFGYVQGGNPHPKSKQGDIAYPINRIVHDQGDIFFAERPV